MAKTTTKPTKGNGKGKGKGKGKAVKGGHYTPPEASRELPYSFYHPQPLSDKGEIPTD